MSGIASRSAAAMAVLALILASAEPAWAPTGARWSPESERQALAVFAAAKAASGGAAWDRITGWRERGRHGGVDYETILDFTRYGARYANTREGVTRMRGFNGQVAWDQAADGSVTASRDPARLAAERQGDYGSIFGFFFPGRFPARLEYLGTREAAGASFDVVNVEPEAASPIEVWVDRSTHRVARFVDRSGAKPVTAIFSDYRRVGDVREPFRVEVGDGDHTETGQVEAVALEPVDRKLFDPPG